MHAAISAGRKEGGAESYIVSAGELIHRNGISLQRAGSSFQLYYTQSATEGATLYDSQAEAIWHGEKIEAHEEYALLYSKDTEQPHRLGYYDYLFEGRF